jgi:peptide/nickel transport system substrate-binding protein
VKKLRHTHLRTALLAGLVLTAGVSGAHAQSTSLRIAAAGNDLGTMDPFRATSTPDIGVVSMMFNGLVRITPGKATPEAIEPDLATSWTSTDDKLSWTFSLRDDVQCHDGAKLTADDVVFSLKRAAAKASSSFFAEYAAFQTIEAADPKTVKIVLSKPVPGFLGLLAPYHGGNIICKAAAEKAGDDFARHPVGTGPFQFVEYQPQQFVKLKANEAYFRGAPHIKEITYRYILSDSSRDLAYQSGEIDLSYGRQDPNWIKRMQQLPNTKVVVLGPGELFNVHLNMTQKPLDDIRVRQAIADAIQRPALVKFKGAEIAREATSIVPAGYLGHVDVGLAPYDPAKAKMLLAEAGYPDGITINSIQTTLPSMMNTMQAVQALLKQAGITLNLAPVDHPTFHAQIRQDLSQVVLYGAARFPVADTYLTQFFESDAIVGKPSAVTNFSHCDIADAEIKAARVEPDPEKQKALWAEAQKKIVEQVCAVPMFELLQLWAWKDTLDFGYPVEASLSLIPPVTEKTRFTN